MEAETLVTDFLTSTKNAKPGAPTPQVVLCTVEGGGPSITPKILSFASGSSGFREETRLLT